MRLDKFSEGKLLVVNLNFKEVGDTDLAALQGGFEKLTRLRVLHVDATQVTVKGLAHLKSLTQLRTLIDSCERTAALCVR